MNIRQFTRTFVCWLLLLVWLVSHARAANELHFDYDQNATIYAIIKNASGQAWNGSAFATWTPNANRGNFDVPMSDAVSAGSHLANFPAGATGQVSWEFYVQVGGSPDSGDMLIAQGGSGYWTGSVFSTLDSASGFDSTQRAQILAALSIDEETGVPSSQTWVIKRIDGQMKAVAVVPKDIEEEIEVFADFRAVIASGDAIDPDDGIVSIELIDDGNSGEVDSPAFADVGEATLWMSAGVRFTITGGTAGQTDRIRVKVLTVGGQTLSAPCSVKVTGG